METAVHDYEHVYVNIHENPRNPGNGKACVREGLHELLKERNGGTDANTIGCSKILCAFRGDLPEIGLGKARSHVAQG